MFGVIRDGCLGSLGMVVLGHYGWVFWVIRDGFFESLGMGFGVIRHRFLESLGMGSGVIRNWFLVSLGTGFAQSGMGFVSMGTVCLVIGDGLLDHWG